MSCAAQERAITAVDAIQQEANTTIKEVHVQAKKREVLTVSDTPWFGNTVIPVQPGEKLPAELAERDVVMTFTGPMTLQTAAKTLQAVIRTRVSMIRADGPESSASEGTFLPAGALPVAGGRVVWEGNIREYLDLLVDHFDAAWRYREGVIELSQHEVRTFLLHSLAGNVDVSGSVSTGDDSGSVGLPTQSVGATANLSVWQEMQGAIESIIGSRGRVSFSPATGTITVAATPSGLKDVEAYIRMQNRMRLRRVAITARVLTVELSENYDYNFDVEAVIEKALENQPFVYQSSTGGSGELARNISSGVLRSIPADLNRNANDSVQAVITALDAIADNVGVAYTGSVVTLSDQPAPLQVSTKRSYVARVSGSTTDGAASVSLEPGTIDIGLSLNLLPRVISKDRVMLRMALGITDLVDIREFSSGDNTIQLPEVDTTGFLQNAILSSGETLVLAGFERRSARYFESGTGIPENWVTGGGKAFGQGRELRVLMLTAEVKPEEPVEVISP